MQSATSWALAVLCWQGYASSSFVRPSTVTSVRRSTMRKRTFHAFRRGLGQSSALLTTTAHPALNDSMRREGRRNFPARCRCSMRKFPGTYPARTRWHWRAEPLRPTARQAPVRRRRGLPGGGFSAQPPQRFQRRGLLSAPQRGVLNAQPARGTLEAGLRRTADPPCMVVHRWPAHGSFRR